MRPTRSRWADINKARAKGAKKGKPWPMVDGIKFQSEDEARRYIELRRQQDMGYISHLERQIHYPIVHPITEEKVCTYIADFRYLRNGVEVTEDVKGGPNTDIFVLKKALVRIFCNIHIREVRRVGGQLANGYYRWRIDGEPERI